MFVCAFRAFFFNKCTSVCQIQIQLFSSAEIGSTLDVLRKNKNPLAYGGKVTFRLGF